MINKRREYYETQEERMVLKWTIVGEKKHEILNAGASLGVVAYLWVQTY